jgi:hypothetical protein
MILTIILYLFYICFMGFMFAMSFGVAGTVPASLFMVFLFVVTYPSIKRIRG